MLPTLALSLGLLGSQPSAPAQPMGLAWSALRRTTVLTDVVADAIYAKGATWKAAFSPLGVTYYPVVGARGKRAFRLDLTLAAMSVGDRELELSPASPVLNGASVTLAHGGDDPVFERYDLAVDSIEQTFVLPASPLRAKERGDLTIRLGSDVDLDFRGREHGLLFDAGGLSSVVYGDATVRDARGASWQFQSEFVGGALQLTVPNEVLRSASYPLAIDPLITNVVIDADADEDTDPAVAFTNGRYLVTYTEVVSGLDTDIVSRRFDTAGNFLDEVGVDLALNIASNSSIAGTGDTFLAVWQRRSTPFADPVIEARSRTASSSAQGAIFDVTTGFVGEANPDVGASPNAIANPFLVVWQDESDPLTQIRSRTVSAAGALGVVANLHAGSFQNSFDPHVTKNAGPNGKYLVCFESVQVGVSQSLVMTGVDQNGVQFDGLGSLESHPVGVPFHADADGNGDDAVVIYENADPNSGSAHDIECDVLRYIPSSNHFFGSHLDFDLSKVEYSALEFADQIEPVVTLNGCRITYGYRSRSLVIADYDVRTATFAIDPLQDGDFGFIETGIQMAQGTAGQPQRLALAAGVGQLDAPVLFAWQASPGASSDILGSLRSEIGAGGVATVQTGCGAPEPGFAIGGPPAIGGFLTLAITGTTNPLLAIGIPTSIPLCPGQGGCILGVNPITMIPIASTITQVPCDPGILGFSVGLQIIDLLPSNATGASCGPPKFTQKFRVSDTKILTFQ